MISFLQKTKGIPIKMNYDIDIVLKSEIDILKASEKIIWMLFNYYFYNIDYHGLKIDAAFNLPDEKTIEIIRDITLDTENKKHIKFSLIVNTYYPSFFEDTDDYEICDNDDEIDWNRMCKTKPSLKNISELSKIRQVYWKNYIWDIKYQDDVKLEDRKNTSKENF
jgi:hypothetical protein